MSSEATWKKRHFTQCSLAARNPTNALHRGGQGDNTGKSWYPACCREGLSKWYPSAFLSLKAHQQVGWDPHISDEETDALSSCMTRKRLHQALSRVCLSPNMGDAHLPLSQLLLERLGVRLSGVLDGTWRPLGPLLSAFLTQGMLTSMTASYIDWDSPQ